MIMVGQTLLSSISKFRDDILCFDLLWDPRYKSSWGQHGAHLGPVTPRWTHVGPMNLAIRVKKAPVLQMEYSTIIEAKYKSEIKISTSTRNPWGCPLSRHIYTFRVNVYEHESYLFKKGAFVTFNHQHDKIRHNVELQKTYQTISHTSAGNASWKHDDREVTHLKLKSRITMTS